MRHVYVTSASRLRHVRLTFGLLSVCVCVACVCEARPSLRAQVLRSAQGTEHRPGKPTHVEVKLEAGGIVAQARTERLRPETRDRLKPGMRVRVKLRTVDMQRGRVNVDLTGVPRGDAWTQ